MAAALPGGLALALACGVAVAAEPTPPGLASCAAVSADSERLACYDRVLGRPATPAAEPTPRQVMTAPPAAAPIGVPQPARYSIDAAWGLDPASDPYIIDLYRPNYILPVRYSSRINNAPFAELFEAAPGDDNELNPVEARFQISFKVRFWTTDDRRWSAWAAYTQQSQWQVYNGDLSRPFRETNYMPEVMLSFRPGLSFAGFNWRLFNFGYNHQSNGRADPISRSWDRLVAELGIERGNFALLIRPWYRIKEDEDQDDNPDIVDYYGYGDITAIYKWHGHSFALMVRGNLETDKGAAQLTWVSPPFLGPIRGYLQAFTGYGDSLIDYNWKQNAIGIGIALNDQLDRL